MIVRHSKGSYPIEFGSLEKLWSKYCENGLIITDTNVHKHVIQRFGLPEPTIVIDPGEASKSLEVYGETVRALAATRLTRDKPIIAVGGGVVGDLAGFVAATYQRGVPFVQVPTSLLAMVDSSVGGKVGIDLPEGKNLVGAFHPPTAVLIDPTTLESLPEREFKNGCAEIWKMAFVLKPDLATNAPLIGPNDPEIDGLIKKCVALKAQVVQEDEFETTGLRAILNFGHTIGHALEKLLGYKDLLHGEAISIGMVEESRLGERLGITSPETTLQLIVVLESQGLPTEAPDDVDINLWVETMKIDKKRLRSDRLSMSLLNTIGSCKLVHDIEPSAVVRSLNQS